MNLEINKMLELILTILIAMLPILLFMYAFGFWETTEEHLNRRYGYKPEHSE